MRRREQREHIFKLLFMTEFNTEQEMTEQLSLYFNGLEEFEDKDKEYIKEKFIHVQGYLDEIDTLLDGVSKGWKTKRMSRVDLTALRLAVYELNFDNDVPVGVAINEAVELAKRYGGETSGSFVNGILGKIANGAGEESGEPIPEESAAACVEAREPGRKRGFGNAAGKIVVVHKSVARPADRPEQKEDAPKAEVSTEASEGAENS